MAIYVKMAETPQEIDGIFQTRHRVFVEEENDMPARLDSRFFDRFDAYPSTGNVIAVDDGRVIGGVRVVEATELGTPADEFFDFADYLPGDVVKLGAGSWFCLERKYRGLPRLSFALMGMSYRWALSRGISHIVCPIRPCAARLFWRNGYKPLASQLFVEKKKLHFIPAILDLKELNHRFMNFLKQHATNQSAALDIAA